MTHTFRLRSTVWLTVLVVALAGCTLGAPENNPGGGALGINDFPLIAQGDREPAPDFCGSTIQEETLCLADLPDHPVLLNFWASWCGPCAREMPALIATAADYGDQISVVGVNEQDSRVNARSFERDQQVTYPSLFDEGAVIAAQFGGIAPEALPSTILLDAEHRVAVRLFGERDQAQLASYLDELTTENLTAGN